MGGHLGKNIHDHGSRQDQGDADDSRQIKMLPVVKPSHQRHERRADPRPDGIGDADRDCLERQGEASESDAITDHHDHRGDEARESLGGFERGGRHHFGDDRNKQDEEGFHRFPGKFMNALPYRNVAWSQL